MAVACIRQFYIKPCSHKVAKHKSVVICHFHPTVPPLATTGKDGNIHDIMLHYMVNLGKCYYRCSTSTTSEFLSNFEIFYNILQLSYCTSPPK
jgi:hypothetical protein